MEDIYLRLTNGRLLRFTPAGEVIHTPTRGNQSTQIQLIEAAAIGSSSFEPASGDSDLMFQRGGDHPEVTLVELKSGGRRSIVPNLSDKELRERMPSLLAGMQPRRELWDVDLDSLRMCVFSVRPDGHVEPKGIRYKIRGLVEPYKDQPANPQGAEVSRESIQRSVNDWLQRLSSLYDDVRSWLEGTEIAARRGDDIPMWEELMQQFEVPQVQMPSLTLDKSSAVIMRFLPRGLFVIGANGRVDLVGKSRSAMLIDTAGPFQQPNWVMYSTHRRGTDQAFNKSALLALLSEKRR